MRDFFMYAPRLLTIVLSTLPAFAAATVDFGREIRPILSDGCFHCHGPDKSTRMAGLRLDTRDGAFAQRKNGLPIAAGKPAESLILQRINHSNAAMRMPPSASHKTISDAQKTTLKRWIEQGAPWTEQWAFIAPTKKPLPALKNAKNMAWPKNPIDNFILAKLETESLTPAAEANRRTLIRRLSLDLTGLPPTPADVEAFAASKAPDAYARLVDKYLDSKHYGEHRARYWLDAARYADTHGIHVDNYREMWPYRDWVINAFNKNLPFDQFTIEQVAGDLLPNRSLDQQIASGFHRCNVTTNEAGVIVEEVEAIYAKDRVDTTSTVFLGLTLGCATCHDHKFDPLSQKDFYSMAAFFRNTTQNAMDGNIPDTPPIIVVPRDEDRARWGQLRGDESEVRAKKTTALGGSTAGFAAWLNGKERRAIPAPLELSDEVLALKVTEKAAILNEGVTKAITLKPGAKISDSQWPGRFALEFAKDGYAELPNQSIFDSGKPFSIATWVYFPKGEDSAAIAGQIDPKTKNSGWLLEIGARVVNFRMTGADGKAITIRAGHMEQFVQGSWNHIAVTYDGTRAQAGLGLYLNGRAVPTQGGGDQNLKLTGNIATTQPLSLGRDPGKGFPDGKIAEFQILNRAISEEEALRISQWPTIEGSRSKDAATLTPNERDALHLYYLTHFDPAYRQLSKSLAALADERRAIRERGSVTLVMEERRDKQPVANILYRGMYDQKRDEVKPAVPSVLPPMPDSFPRNRLGLAQWLVSADNPLVSRVYVNRLWQEIFGTGIVKTSEDFGSQGQPPSHPQLLDWLAVEFRESGWDIKKLVKLMVTSAAYRQEATTTPGKLKKDPENRLLSRGPRFRLDGELVRDYALAASGLLTNTVGGPSVKPYQPEGVWEAVAMNGSNTRFYKPDTGDKLYRRSLYTFWKRSAPPASMDIFNAPTRESCTVRRERTNTPLQALVTMNDPQFVEASRQLAQSAIHEGGQDFNKTLDAITIRALARPFTAKEKEVVRRAFTDLKAHYDAHPDQAHKLIAVGESKHESSIPAPAFAAWTMVSSNVLNLDEALNK